MTILDQWGTKRCMGAPWDTRNPEDQRLTNLGNVAQGIFTVTITRIGSNPKYASNFDRAFTDSKPKKKTVKKKKTAKKKTSRKSKR